RSNTEALEREQKRLGIGLDPPHVVAANDRRERREGSPSIEKRQRPRRRSHETEQQSARAECLDRRDGSRERLDLGSVAAQPVRPVVAVERGEKRFTIG